MLILFAIFGVVTIRWVFYKLVLYGRWLYYRATLSFSIKRNLDIDKDHHDSREYFPNYQLYCRLYNWQLTTIISLLLYRYLKKTKKKELINRLVRYVKQHHPLHIIHSLQTERQRVRSGRTLLCHTVYGGSRYALHYLYRIVERDFRGGNSNISRKKKEHMNENEIQ